MYRGDIKVSSWKLFGCATIAPTAHMIRITAPTKIRILENEVLSFYVNNFKKTCCAF